MNLTAALAVLRRHAETSMHNAGLSDRQIEVARLMMRGLNNRDIGAHLGISEKTVVCHIGAIYGKLNIVQRAQLFPYFFPVFNEPGA
jgi:DNA-binding NarL/FixJ family response regulator